jgi:endonuclease/exonuclease/phosphatase family metal-dependent hydrolase
MLKKRPHRRITPVTVAAATLALLVTLPPGSAQAGAAVPSSISIMTFNIEYGGTVVDLGSILRAVRRADADIVAFNEVYGKAARLGRLTGYDHVSRRLDLVSRYPIVEAPGSGGRYVFVQLAPGHVVALSNVHLASSDYGPRRLLDGWSTRKVLRTERAVRVPDLRPFVRATAGLADAGIPTFVVGDFNSHGLHRLVACRAPRPRRRRGPHVARRASAFRLELEPSSRRTARPHRPDLVGGTGDRDRERARG